MHEYEQNYLNGIYFPFKSCEFKVPCSKDFCMDTSCKP